MTDHLREHRPAGEVDALELEAATMLAALGELVNAAIHARAHVSARRSRFDSGGQPDLAQAVERTLHELDCAIAAAQNLL